MPTVPRRPHRHLCTIFPTFCSQTSVSVHLYEVEEECVGFKFSSFSERDPRIAVPISSLVSRLDPFSARSYLREVSFDTCAQSK